MAIKFKNLDGSEIKVEIKQSDYPMRDEKNCKSKAQWRFGQKIKQFFPHEIILEEFVLPRTNGLSLDFFIPHRKIAFEVHGQQHYKYVDFYHGSREKFVAQKKRDDKKSQWCELNSIRLIEVSDSDVDSAKIGGLLCKKNSAT
jgi:hypothetical protein